MQQTSPNLTKTILNLVRWPNLLMMVLSQYLARIFLVGGQEHWWQYFQELPIFLIALSTVLIAASGYIINDYFDVKIDLINKPEKVVIGRFIRRRKAMIAHHALNIIGCLLGLYVSVWVFLVNVLAVGLLWLYSSYFKRKPLVGNLTVSLLAGLMLLVLAVYYRTNTDMILLYAAFSFGISLIRELFKDIEDIKGDATHGCQTLPIVWGVLPTKKLLFVLMFLLVSVPIYISIKRHNVALHNTFVALACAFIFLAFRLAKADTQKAYRFLSQLCKIIMLFGILSMIWV